MVIWKAIKSKIIYGCESRGDGDSPYLTRWTLWETAYGSMYLHHFHRSDGDEHHDHPWPFVSLILWPGYWEEVAGVLHPKTPGTLLFRAANWRHRVQLFRRNSKDVPCWTLLWVGQKERDWGFFTKSGWQVWTEYFRERGC